VQPLENIPAFYGYMNKAKAMQIIIYDNDYFEGSSKYKICISLFMDSSVPEDEIDLNKVMKNKNSMVALK
jgi:hypothetical protein